MNTAEEILSGVYSERDLNPPEPKPESRGKRYQRVLENIAEGRSNWGPEARKAVAAWKKYHCDEFIAYMAGHWHQYGKNGIEGQSGLDVEIEEVI